MIRPVIGFFGLKDAGKDEAALGLRDAGWDCEIYKFATPLKEMASCLLKVPVSAMNGDTEKDREFREKDNEALIALTGGKIKTPRYLLQWIGTDAFRSLHEDIWVKHLEYRMKDGVNAAFITDCRFPNEMGLIKRLEGICVKIVRAGQETNSDAHASEAMPFKDSDFDAIIKNEGSLSDFRRKVADAVRDLVACGKISRSDYYMNKVAGIT